MFHDRKRDLPPINHLSRNQGRSVIAEGFWDAAMLKTTCLDNSKMLAEFYNFDGQDGQMANAVHHCTVACCMADQVGIEGALKILDAHENDALTHILTASMPTEARLHQLEYQALHSPVDNHNNRVGVGMGMVIGDCTPRILCCLTACLCAWENGGLQHV